MKKSIILALLLSMISILAACTVSTPKLPSEASNTTKSAEYQKITAQQAKARMDSGEDIIIVDVRTKEEYEESHIDGAILIPNESIGSAQPARLPDLNAEILIYCRSGNRSAQAAKKLVAMGYTKVYDFGGIIDWPYSTVSGPEKVQGE